MHTNTSEKQPVKVTILSRPYTLLASGDARDVEEVAAGVNDLMLCSTVISYVPGGRSAKLGCGATAAG